MTALCPRGLHVLADAAPGWRHDPVAQARAACEGGARVVQLRAKSATDREALAWGREIRALTRERGVGFVVNDRADWALACAADGVHLGQEDLAPGDLPDWIRARLAVGRSTHGPTQARHAVSEAPDYIAYGPLFDTASKDTGYGPRGLDALREIVAIAGERPVVAIGGIDAERARSAIRAGAAGVAVISAVAAAADPVAATRALVDAIGSA